MTYDDLVSQYNYYQNVYNQTINNPSMQAINQNAFNKMQEIQYAMSQAQVQNRNGYYGQNFQPPMYQQQYQQPIGVPAQQMMPQFQQYNQPAPNFGTQINTGGVPSMQMPDVQDRNSGGRYQKMVKEATGRSVPQFSQGFQSSPVMNAGNMSISQPAVQQPAPVVPPKPTKFIPGHKWSYLCGKGAKCQEEIQGDYISYKVSSVSNLTDSKIDNVTDKDQTPLCLEKAVNKYNFILNDESAGFVDLKFTNVYHIYELDEIVLAIGDITKTKEETSFEYDDMKKRISEYITKISSSAEDQLKLLSKIFNVAKFIDYRYSGLFNDVVKTQYEANIKVDNVLWDHKDILDAVSQRYDEKVFSGASRLIDSIRKRALESDKISLTFVEGETREDTYLKVKWEYTNKGMFGHEVLLKTIEDYINVNTVDKGKSPYYKITSQSYKSLYEILNQCDWNEDVKLYIFNRDDDSRFIAYEIIKGDLGAFYIKNEKVHL